jgi:hypothetical protein
MIPIIKKIDRRSTYILLSLFFFIILFLGFIIFQLTLSTDVYKVETFKVSDGWGYKIKIKNRDFIYQPFIPGIAGGKAFPDKKTATRAGNLVKKKLESHKLPSLTKEDIKKIGLDNLGNSD